MDERRNLRELPEADVRLEQTAHRADILLVRSLHRAEIACGGREMPSVGLRDAHAALGEREHDLGIAVVARREGQRVERTLELARCEEREALLLLLDELRVAMRGAGDHARRDGDSKPANDGARKDDAALGSRVHLLPRVSCAVPAGSALFRPIRSMPITVIAMIRRSRSGPFRSTYSMSY